MEGLVIRDVKKEDLLDIANIVVDGWRTAYRGIIDDKFIDSMKVEEIYQNELKNYQENEFIVAELNNEIVGFCRYTLTNQFSKEFRKIDCELCVIYVKSTLKRQGIGSALVSHVINEQKNAGNKTMVLWCLKDNYKARVFYEKMGGELYKKNKLRRGGKTYKMVGFKYDLTNL